QGSRADQQGPHRSLSRKGPARAVGAERQTGGRAGADLQTPHRRHPLRPGAGDPAPPAGRGRLGARLRSPGDEENAGPVSHGELLPGRLRSGVGRRRPSAAHGMARIPRIGLAAGPRADGPPSRSRRKKSAEPRENARTWLRVPLHWPAGLGLDWFSRPAWPNAETDIRPVFLCASRALRVGRFLLLRACLCVHRVKSVFRRLPSKPQRIRGMILPKPGATARPAQMNLGIKKGFLETMRAVVTGGAGFLGSHLCEKLLENGWDVLCVDNLVTGADHNIAHLAAHPGFRVQRHDVSLYIDVAGPVDYVLHFASPASPVDYTRLPIQTLKVGALGTHNSLGLALAKKAKFLLASTSECYGDPLVSPQKETYWGNVNPIGPRGVYDEAKRFAEGLTLAYKKVHKMDVKIIRIFNTYGPRMRLKDGRVVPSFIDQVLHGKPLTIYGDGKQTRSFCYVDDLVDGITKLLLSKISGPVNIGNPKEFTILEFAHLIRKKYDSKAKIIYKPLPQDDPKQRRPDISLARKELGWEPKVPLEEGIMRTMKWFSENCSQ